MKKITQDQLKSMPFENILAEANSLVNQHAVFIFETLTFHFEDAEVNTNYKRIINFAYARFGVKNFHYEHANACCDRQGYCYSYWDFLGYGCLPG